jgi:hypothetical protein
MLLSKEKIKTPSLKSGGVFLLAVAFSDLHKILTTVKNIRNVNNILRVLKKDFICNS